LNKLRLLLFILVAAIHGLAIVFVAFNVRGASGEPEEKVRVMKLTDIAELSPPPEIPPPPPPPKAAPPPENAVETIAEDMIETEGEPENQSLVEAGSIVVPRPSVSAEEEYLPAHKISVLPAFPDDAILSAIRYPVIARNSNIQGRVILDLFIDRTGIVRRIDILLEDPPDRGFGEAARKAFQEALADPKNRCKPALANGEPVSARVRYPVSFRLRR
jgi:protein TonB